MEVQVGQDRFELINPNGAGNCFSESCSYGLANKFIFLHHLIGCQEIGKCVQNLLKANEQWFLDAVKLYVPESYQSNLKQHFANISGNKVWLGTLEMLVFPFVFHREVYCEALMPTVKS